MIYKSFWALLFCFATLLSCKTDKSKIVEPFTVSDLNKANRALLNVAMEDGFPPPIASRVYVYPHIASYIALYPFYSDSLQDLSKKLNDFGNIPTLDTVGIDAHLGALMAFYKVAKKIVFSEHYMISGLDSLKLQAKIKGYDEKTIKNTEKYAEQISTHIISWLVKDNYIETRTMERYMSTKGQPDKWTETPPDYQQGLEPHWMKIRPLILDSASIYKATPIPPFSTDKNSAFYKMVEKVYQQSKSLTDEMVDIAWFWDDNPNTSDHKGHSVAVIHKISPPGHWLNIIHQISDREGYSFEKTSKLYTLTAISMFDVIISTWHEKYKTNLVRPITYIQANIDKNWTPLIQTPPFPEYTSGHSAISAAAATALTHFLGDNFKFNDKTAELFGAKSRNFESFNKAAWEVSLSRYYGGIHYYNGVEEGNKQGKWISNYILSKLK